MATLLTHPPEAAETTKTLIELAGVEKVYRNGKLEYPALRGVDLSVAAGELVAIVGPSGSGKSTIINMITGIDCPTAGSVIVDGERIDQMSEEELASWRGENVGIVFQFFQLLPTLTALENAVLPLDFSHHGPKHERFERAARDLELVGVGRQARPSPLRAFGRGAAAGRDRALAGLRSEADRRGRADRQPGLEHGGGDVRGAGQAQR
jgi:putative ABC transport system ATP-binding protein